MQDVWNAREEQFNSPPQFFDYFKKHKAAVFKESMIKPVRMKAGLGNPPTEYHNNSPECINHVIKMKVDHKRNALDDFCSKMKSLVDDQQNLLIRAITSRGEYRLHPVFKDFEVDHLKWFSFNETTRSNHIKKLRSAASKRMSMFQSHNSSTHQEDSSSLGPSHEEYQDVLYKCTNIPKSTLENILEKATEILRDKNAITCAPVEGIARMVKSKSNPTRPHIVQVLKKGKITCDENCLMWMSLKLCAHCVAVAMKLDCLNDFVHWYIGNVKEPNITKLTTNSVSHNVGKKPNTRYSKRKKKLPVTTRVKPTYSSPSCPSDSVTPTSTCSSVENTSTSYVPTPNPDPSPYPLYYPTPYSMQFPFTPGMYGWQGFNSFECDKVPQMPLSSSQYAFSNPSSSATAMPFTTPLSSATPKCIFWVCKLNNRITTCFGCRGKFT